MLVIELSFKWKFLYSKIDFFTFLGTGDPDKCMNEIQLILKTNQCNYDSCAFDNTYQPPIKNRNFYVSNMFSLVILNFKIMLHN